MPNRLLWSSASREHDWRGAGFPARMIERAAAAGVIGRAEWIDLGAGTQAEPVEAVALAGRLFEGLPRLTVPVTVAAGGNAPQPWSLHLTTEPLNPAVGHVGGANVLNLRFERAPWESAERATLLLAAFLEAHTSEDTEVALMHPFERWVQLAGSVHKPDPRRAPLFCAAFWATFIGGGHLRGADPERLRSVSAWRTKAVDDRGFFAILGPTPASAEGAAGEEELARVTKALRYALAPGPVT